MGSLVRSNALAALTQVFFPFISEISHTTCHFTTRAGKLNKIRRRHRRFLNLFSQAIKSSHLLPMRRGQQTVSVQQPYLDTNHQHASTPNICYTFPALPLLLKSYSSDIIFAIIYNASHYLMSSLHYCLHCHLLAMS